MKLPIIALLLTGAAFADITPSESEKLPAPIHDKDYQLIFEDQFDGPEGASPDATKWKPLLPGKWRSAWNMEDAARLDGKGNLVISMRRNGDRVETGYIGTPDRFEATHGYFECRARVLNTKGAWCAFWVQSPSLGDPVGDCSTAGVELDVIEYFGPHWEYKDQTRHTAHWDGYGKDHKAEGVGKLYPEITKRFCTFAMKWDEEGYVFYTDGIETGRLSKAPMSNRPQYLILSCEVEKWCGKIEEAVLPDAFTIDYVRVWQTPAQIKADATRAPILTPNGARNLVSRKGYFNWLDKNHDLQLSCDEFMSDRKDRQKGETAFAEFDRNQDKILNREEFFFFGRKPIPNMDKAIADVLAKDRPRQEKDFKALDKDQDGKVSKDEFIGLEPEDKKADADQRFTKYDKDKNGIVSLDEFVNQGL